MTQAQFMECLSDAEQLEHFRRYCFYLAGNLADGDETANEALTRAWKHLASIENCDHLWKWLRRVAHNYHISIRRRRKPEELTGELQYYEGKLEDIEPAIYAEFDAADLVAALESLSDMQRSVIVLAKVEGLSYAEIAQLLEISNDQVKNSLFRGLNHLRHYLLGSRVRIIEPADSTTLVPGQPSVLIRIRIVNGLPEDWRLFLLLNQKERWSTPAAPLTIGKEQEFVHQLPLRPAVEDGQPFQIHAVVANGQAAKKLREAMESMKSLPTGAVDSAHVRMRFQTPDSGRVES